MRTRLERTGGPPNLERAMEAFAVRVLRGRSLDDNSKEESRSGKYPDFACLGDRLLIEMKHLLTGQGERLQQVFEDKTDENERPLFFGTRNAESVFESISNPDELRKAVFDKLARTIETHLRKANKQFENYKKRSRKNVVTICVFLNSQVYEFGPENFVACLRKLIAARESRGETAFPHIDAVILISEKHYSIAADGRAALPIVSFRMKGIAVDAWKKQFIDLFQTKWSEFRTGDRPLNEADVFSQRFEAIDDIPERMTRSDEARLEYRRNPYLRTVSFEELRRVFNRNVVISSIAFVKGNWPKPTMSETLENVREFTHLLEEINARGLDMREFAFANLPQEDREFAFEGIPAELRAILEKVGDENK